MRQLVLFCRKNLTRVMAIFKIAEGEILKLLQNKVENFNGRVLVLFREGDVLKLNVSKELNCREVSPKGIAPFQEYSFELTRKGRKLQVWTSLGTFCRIPLPKNGYNIEDAESQRMLSNNAIFSDFEMRSAEEILESLKKGVRCDKIYQSTTSSGRCYRWVTAWSRGYLEADPGKKTNGSSELTGRSQTNCPH